MRRKQGGADSDKTAAIVGMSKPENVSDLRRFMGMINQLGKFSRRLAEISQPLRELFSSKRSWTWGPNQEQAFSELKTELTRPTVLAVYDPQAEKKDLCWCFLVWAWCCTPPANKRLLETCSLCLTLNVWYRKTLCSNREGGSCHYMGMRNILRLHSWQTLSDWVGPYAADSYPEYKTLGWSASPCSSLSAMNGKIWLYNSSRSQKIVLYNRHSISSPY